MLYGLGAHEDNFIIHRVHRAKKVKNNNNNNIIIINKKQQQ